MSIYSVATLGDNDSSETALYSNITGELLIDQATIKESETGEDVEELFLFVPDQILPLVARGQKMVDADSQAYAILRVESYDTHQEVYARKRG